MPYCYIPNVIRLPFHADNHRSNLNLLQQTMIIYSKRAYLFYSPVVNVYFFLYVKNDRPEYIFSNEQVNFCPKCWFHLKLSAKVIMDTVTHICRSYAQSVNNFEQFYMHQVQKIYCRKKETRCWLIKAQNIKGVLKEKTCDTPLHFNPTDRTKDEKTNKLRAFGSTSRQ